MMGWKVKERQRYALIEQDSEDPRKHRGTFYVGPRHVKHHTTKEFVEFSYATAPSFASEKDCRVFAQNSHAAIEVYDYYTKLFDPDYETVSVYDERFIVQYQKGTKWRDVDAYNPTIQVIPSEDGVEIKRIFDTDCGQQTLEISHIIKTGRRLKHNIAFANKTAETKTFRVVMKLAGITHTKVKHKEGETDVSKEASIGKQPFFFVGEDEQHLTLSEHLWSLGVADAETGEWTPTKLEDIIFDVHAEGCKADILIGNYSLGENESLLIDPDSDTWQVGASNDDCARRKQTGSWYSRTSSYVRVGYVGSSLYAYGGGIRFTGLNISQGAAIDHAYLKLTCKTSRSGTTCNSKISAEDIDNASEFPDNADDFDARYNNHTSAVVNWDDISAWTAETEYTSPDMKTVVQEVIDRSGWSSGNAIAVFLEDFDERSSHQNYANRDAYSYDGSSSKAPRLEVTWTSGGQTYTRTWNADTLFKKLGIAKNAAVDAAFKKADITKTTVADTAFKKPDIPRTFGLDSAFLKTGKVQKQIDALLKKLGALQTFGLDVHLLEKGILKSFAIDLRLATVMTYTIQRQIDALFKKLGITKEFTVDVHFQKTEQLQRQIDVLFRNTLTVQKQIQALFQKLSILREFGVDVDFLKRDVIKSFAIDARFAAVITYTINKQIDVLFRKLGITKTFVIDTEFLKAQQIQRQVNALFRRSLTVQKQIDALFKKLGITKGFMVDVDFMKSLQIQRQIDALFRESFTIQKQIDVLFGKLDVTKEFAVGVDFMKSLQIQRQVNALFRKSFTVQKQIDALFKKLGVAKGFAVDVDFLKIRQIEGQIDVLFRGSFAVQKQIDALFERLDVAKGFVVDVDFQKAQQAQRQIDVLFRKSFTVQRQIDALLQKSFITQKQVDAIFKKPSIQKTMSIDVIFCYKVKLPSILGITLDGQLVIPLKKEIWVES